MGVVQKPAAGKTKAKTKAAPASARSSDSTAAKKLGNTESKRSLVRIVSLYGQHLTFALYAQGGGLSAAAAAAEDALTDEEVTFTLSDDMEFDPQARAFAHALVALIVELDT